MKLKTILIAAFLSAVSLSACSALNQAPVNPAHAENVRAERVAAEEKAPPATTPDPAEYQYVPNSNNPRPAEKMKIHQMARDCIRANNTSAACNELIMLDTKQGKLFIQQETGSR